MRWAGQNVSTAAAAAGGPRPILEHAIFPVSKISKGAARHCELAHHDQLSARALKHIGPGPGDCRRPEG
jgi:hypothetical protein